MTRLSKWLCGIVTRANKGRMIGELLFSQMLKLISRLSLSISLVGKD